MPDRIPDLPATPDEPASCPRCGSPIDQHAPCACEPYCSQPMCTALRAHGRDLCGYHHAEMVRDADEARELEVTDDDWDRVAREAEGGMTAAETAQILDALEGRR